MAGLAAAKARSFITSFQLFIMINLLLGGLCLSSRVECFLVGWVIPLKKPSINRWLVVCLWFLLSVVCAPFVSITIQRLLRDDGRADPMPCFKNNNFKSLSRFCRPDHSGCPSPLRCSLIMKHHGERSHAAFHPLNRTRLQQQQRSLPRFRLPPAPPSSSFSFNERSSRCALCRYVYLLRSGDAPTRHRLHDHWRRICSSRWRGLCYCRTH